MKEKATFSQLIEKLRKVANSVETVRQYSTFLRYRTLFRKHIRNTRKFNIEENCSLNSFEYKLQDEILDRLKQNAKNKRENTKIC